jgi:hypothetical protein
MSPRLGRAPARVAKIGDVAQRAGVSPATVSRVLTPRGNRLRSAEGEAIDSTSGTHCLGPLEAAPIASR